MRLKTSPTLLKSGTLSGKTVCVHGISQNGFIGRRVHHHIYHCFHHCFAAIKTMVLRHCLRQRDMRTATQLVGP